MGDARNCFCRMDVLRWAVFVAALLGAGNVGEAEERDVMVAFAVNGNKSVTTEPDAWVWFQTYGWSGQKEDGPEQLLDMSTLQAYVRRLQEIYGLTVNGELDAPTRALMSTPRCGYPDFGPDGFMGDSQTRKKRFTRTGTVWNRKTITYYIQSNTPDLRPDEIRNAIVTAFQRWDVDSGLTLLEASSANRADIVINFNTGDHGDGNSFDGRGGTLAHAYGPGFGIGGDAHFDDDELFTVGNSGVDLHIVATHEFGHSLGLGHSTDSNAVMAPFYRYVADFKLMSDDIAGIRALYGDPPQQPPEDPPTPPPRPPTPRATTTTQAPTTTPPPPAYCNGRLDAVTNSFDGGLYFFQGPFVIKSNRVGNQWVVQPGYPRYIWLEFPNVYTAYVDAAVLFRYSTGQKFLYIFKGDDYWLVTIDGNNEPLPADNRYPLRISEQWGGVPSNLDAAFFWTGNSYLYFIKGDQYWRFNFYIGGIDSGYPRPVDLWRNVQLPVADAFDYRGETYFFNEAGVFQLFNDAAFQAGNLKPIASNYLGCRTFGVEEESTDAPPITCGMDNGSTTLAKNVLSVLLLTMVVYFLGQI